MSKILICLWALLASAFSVNALAETENWLIQRGPIAVQGVGDTAVVTDGSAPLDGEIWNSPRAVVMQGAEPRLVYDLGSTQHIGCLWVQGDNNDDYAVFQSQDGQNFSLLWIAPPTGAAGLRLRHASVQGQARYLALIPRGGDGYYSVSEFGAAAQCPPGAPASLVKRIWLSDVGQLVKAKILIATLLGLLWVFVPTGSGAIYRRLLSGAALIAAAIALQALYLRYPLFEEESLLRAVVAALALTIALREGFGAQQTLGRRRIHSALLGILALTAVGCYYHFGTHQFWDHANARRTSWHPFDMRHYFPQAKYFGELRFDGLYVASLGAYLDNTPGAKLENLVDVRLRDLNTSEMRYAPTYAPELAEVRARFTDARWAEFCHDMLYIQRTMGDRDYLGSMQDHGGNATPVWILPAWLLFKHLPASEATLGLAGLIDPALLLILLIAIWRSFGLSLALYCTILFGATDFYMFGSNLMGSTLRQDWLVTLGLGACALKSGRHWLGGALLAYAGLVRAFPAMATIFLAVPLLWWLVECMRLRRWPTFQAAWAAQRDTLKAGLGATALVVALFTLTSAVFGMQDAWGNWYEKISIHAADPSVNNIGMRNLMSFDPSEAARHVLRRDHPEPWVEWQRLQRETYDARLPLTIIFTIAGIVLCVFAARRRPLHQVALIGLLTIPFLFYPSNYYFHYIFLLPLALHPLDNSDPRLDKNFAAGVAALLLLCVGQYFTTFEGWSDLKFTYQNFLLFGACITLPVILIRARRKHST